MGNALYRPVRCIPLVMRLYRFYLYAMMGKDFLGFHQEMEVSVAKSWHGPK